MLWPQIVFSTTGIWNWVILLRRMILKLAPDFIFTSNCLIPIQKEKNVPTHPHHGHPVLPAGSDSGDTFPRQLFLGYVPSWPPFKGPHMESLPFSCQPGGGHSRGVGQGCFTPEILGISCLGAPGTSSHPYVGRNQTGIMIMFFAMSNYKKQMSKENSSHWKRCNDLKLPLT